MHRLKIVIGAGAAAILTIIALGTVNVVERTERIAWQTARQNFSPAPWRASAFSSVPI